MSIRVLLCLFLVFVLVQGVQAAESYAFVTKWGGTGDGQFNQPTGVATDSVGNVYVADLSGQILKFSSTGVFLGNLWTFGPGEAEPAGIAVDPSGNFYITQSYYSRIQKYDATGALVTKWGSEGKGDGEFFGLWGIAVDSSGNVYAADTGNLRIQKFSPGGTFLAKWGSLGSGDGQFANPMAVAVDSSGNSYVIDVNNNRIQKFSPSGTFLTKWGSPGSGDGQFNEPYGIGVDTSGNVYVADKGNHRIQKFNSNGIFLAKWGSEGNGDGQFEYPAGVAVDPSGNVFVADSGNKRIQKFALQTINPVATPAPASLLTTVRTTVPAAVPTAVPTTSVPAKAPFITIHPLTDKYAGDTFTITAQTNLAADEEVVVRIYSSSYQPTQKTVSSDFSGITGTVRVVKGDNGMNRISFDVDTSTFKPDKYTVTEETVNGAVTSTAWFSVLTVAAAQTQVLTTTLPPPTTTQAVATPLPTPAISPPSQESDLSAYAGIILIVVVILGIAGAGIYGIQARKKKRLPQSPQGSPAKDPTQIARTSSPLPQSSPPQKKIEFKFTPPDTPKQLPQELSDRYTDIELIGKGGFARVFKARRKDGKDVAVKIPLSIDAETGKTFIAELQNWTKLDHPNIVRVFDYNIMPLPYFEMELCDSSLADVKKPLDCEEAAWIVFHICEGLKYAHARSIAHRDLKPENILLKEHIPKISDWGLSRIISKSTSTTSSSSFTPYYAAPEQVNNRPKDERTDIWQLGVILYELTTGILPFNGDSVVEIVVNISTMPYTPPSALNPDILTLEPIIGSCLEKDPARRFQTVTALQTSLGMYLRKNYADLFKQSISVKDIRRSAYYVGDLIIVNLIIGDLHAAYKYSTDLMEYSQGDARDLVRELCGQLDIRIGHDITEVPVELIRNAEFVIHKVRMEFKKQG